MKRYAPHIVASLLLCSLFFLPSIAKAQSLKLIVCDPTSGTDCTYADLITLVKNIIDDLIVLSTILVTAGLMFVGFKILLPGANANAMAELKKIAGKLVWGYLIILCAWLLVYTITSVLLNQGFSILGTLK